MDTDKGARLVLENHAGSQNINTPTEKLKTIFVYLLYFLEQSSSQENRTESHLVSACFVRRTFIVN